MRAPRLPTRPASPPSFRQLRAQRKRAKYGDAVAAVGGEFIAAVMERYGACSDDLCRLAALACGDGDRELSEADDWYFTAPSRRSYFMQGVVFAGVMADAAMVDTAIALDHAGVGGSDRPGASAGWGG